MRVAFLACARENCGWLVDFCVDQKARGHEVLAIIDRGPGDLAGNLGAAGIRCEALALTFGTTRDRSRVFDYAAGIPLAAARVARLLRRERIDVVQSHIFTAIVIGRVAARLAGTRHVAVVPGPRHLEAPLTRQADRLTWWLDAVTAAGCRDTFEQYRAMGRAEDRLAMIYYGSDESRFDPARVDGARVRAEYGIPASAPVVGLVAHFYAPQMGFQEPTHTSGIGAKGHETFLEAAKVVAREIPDVRFILAGSGVGNRGEPYRQHLIDVCRHDDLLRDRVVFTGKYADIPSLLAALDVAVQCSLTENLGGTIEALMMERPVIATTVGGMPEAVRHERTGLLVPPRDPAKLADAMLRLLRDQPLARTLGRNGRTLMLSRFTLRRTVDDLDAILQRARR